MKRTDAFRVYEGTLPARRFRSGSSGADLPESVVLSALARAPFAHRLYAVLRTLPALSALLFLSLTGCDDDGVGPGPVEVTELGVVVNSIELSLTLFHPDDPEETSSVGLGADGTPVGAAVRGELAVVPMGVVPTVAVVDLEARALSRTISLPEGSGATGAAFANDSVVLVANPERNSVSLVNVLSGATGEELSVGGFPQTVVVEGDRAYVVNSELDAAFQPDGPGTVSVLDLSALEGVDGAIVVGTIELSGTNPSDAAIGPDGRLHVLNGGSWGMENGSLSVVDPQSLVEIAHHDGFGDFPGSLAFSPTGDLVVSSYSFGLIAWDPGPGTFIHPPEDPVQPGGTIAVSDLAFDEAGRLWVLRPECQSPGRAIRLTSEYEARETAEVGVCPTGIAFTRVPEG